MSATQWSTRPSVIESLEQHPEQYDFFQAVRLLQLSLRESNHVDPESALGEEISFFSSLSLAFPAGEIEALRVKQPVHDEEFITSKSLSSKRYRLCPTMIGLTGPMGALPVVYTQGLSAQVTIKQDSAAASFLDLFNNRLICLFFKAATRHSLPLQYEIKGRHAYLDHLHALAGYTPTKSSEPTIDEAFAQFGGLIQGQQVSGESLRQVLSSYLNEQVSVDQFIPEWFDIPEDQRTCLGGSFAQLGQTTFCGARVQQIDSRIRLNIGPLSQKTYDALLPNGKTHVAMKQLLTRWCNPTILIEIVLILDKSAVHAAQLGSDAHRSLGQGLFLLSRPVDQHQSQTSYMLN
ncbi:MAG: type VI secretion system baseplate subunit TssG [Aquirhabdus sp.]